MTFVLLEDKHLEELRETGVTVLKIEIQKKLISLRGSTLKRH
jgi:hypothetical protein